MRRFLEDVLSNIADLSLLFSDWLVLVLSPGLEAVEEFLTNMTAHSLTVLVIHISLLIGVLI